MGKIKKNNDTFQMYCPKCNREYNVDAHDPNPLCDCGGPLDFEPVGGVIENGR